jgi:hypothetical protein
VRSTGVLVCLTLVGCSTRGVESTESKELIPAEWTVAEDTSATGDVTTASLQLPAAKDISGLLDNEGSRLVLRCMDGKVEAFIDTEIDSATGTDRGLRREPARIELDSAPTCE